MSIDLAYPPGCSFLVPADSDRKDVLFGDSTESGLTLAELAYDRAIFGLDAGRLMAIGDPKVPDDALSGAEANARRCLRAVSADRQMPSDALVGLIGAPSTLLDVTLH